MKVAASKRIRALYPTLLEIPAEPGFVDLTIIHRDDWDDQYQYRSRQLRYMVVGSDEQAHTLLRDLGHERKEDCTTGG